MDYIEWDGTERCLEFLMIWWGSRIPWEHSEGCEGGMHCCQGVHKYESNYFIQQVPGHTGQGIVFDFGDSQENKTLVEVGDRIYYRGKGVFELVKK